MIGALINLISFDLKQFKGASDCSLEKNIMYDEENTKKMCS